MSRLCWLTRVSHVFAFAGAASGCGGIQSTLAPAGRDASTIAGITLWLTLGAVVLWLGVMGLALFAARTRRTPSDTANLRIIIGGGVILPLILLPMLLVAGLGAMPRLLSLSADDRLTIAVIGGQWWWRIRYERQGLPPVELANEIHLPLSRRVNLQVSSADVIHSFWIPSLAGKMDMIPGRVNRLALEPLEIGSFRGACAEFCGLSHARMNLIAVVTDDARFETWLARQEAPAQEPTTVVSQQGRTAFMSRGCATCHQIRGTGALGRSGPDLTHVGSRATIAAGALPATADGFRRWIAATHTVKPGARMPAFAHLPDDELSSLAEYLTGLQ